MTRVEHSGKCPYSRLLNPLPEVAPRSHNNNKWNQNLKFSFKILWNFDHSSLEFHLNILMNE